MGASVKELSLSQRLLRAEKEGKAKVSWEMLDPEPRRDNHENILHICTIQETRSRNSLATPALH